MGKKKNIPGKTSNPIFKVCSISKSSNPKAKINKISKAKTTSSKKPKVFSSNLKMVNRGNRKMTEDLDAKCMDIQSHKISKKTEIKTEKIALQIPKMKSQVKPHNIEEFVEGFSNL